MRKGELSAFVARIAQRIGRARFFRGKGRMDTANRHRRAQIPPTNPPGTGTDSASRYSAWFRSDPAAAAGNPTIQMPGDAPPRVVRPALSVLFRIAVGPAADRYVKRFMAFERAGHARAGWNWPSLFFPAAWAFYRKLWALGALYALLPVAGAFVFTMIEPWFERADLVWIGAAVLCVWILPGVLPALLADTFLYNDCRYRVFRAEQDAEGATQAVQRLAEATPTSTAAALFFGGGALICILGIVVPPLAKAYHERGVRMQVTQALAALREIEDDIEARWNTSRLLPKQTAHAGLRAHPAANLVAAVHVDPASGRLRVQLSAALPELAGKTLLVAPTRDARNRWQWMCVPVDIPERYLPPECRG